MALTSRRAFLGERKERKENGCHSGGVRLSSRATSIRHFTDPLSAGQGNTAGTIKPSQLGDAAVVVNAVGRAAGKRRIVHATGCRFLGLVAAL